jgi:DNA-binding transcriptional LysR family regulator
MARDLDLTLVRTFVLAAEHASMTVAARVLHRTQGAVSQHIKRLEEALGASLFDRGPKGLRPTPFAERFLPKARQILALNDEIWSQTNAQTVSGRVRLGLPYDLVAAFAPVVRDLAILFPEVEVSLDCRSSPELLDALAEGQIDIALAEELANDAVGEILRIEPLVWVGAKGGQSHLRSPLAVSMVSPTCAFRTTVLTSLEGAGLSWRTTFESGNLDATASMVGADLAVTAWLAGTVPADLQRLDQSSGLPNLPAFALTLHLGSRHPTAAVTAMANALRKSAPTLMSQPDELDPSRF